MIEPVPIIEREMLFSVFSRNERIDWKLSVPRSIMFEGKSRSRKHREPMVVVLDSDTVTSARYTRISLDPFSPEAKKFRRLSTTAESEATVEGQIQM